MAKAKKPWAKRQSRHIVALEQLVAEEPKIEALFLLGRVLRVRAMLASRMATNQRRPTRY